MSRSLFLAAALAATTSLAAQESYWIANRGSLDVMEISACGEVLNTYPLGIPLRSAHLAPDGKIWVVRSGSTQFDILNPDGTVAVSPNGALGSPYEIAFDAAGHAWVSGGTGVEEFDANGNSLNTYPLTAGAPLGITVDADGNKWIAHRVGPPGSVSRIDGTTGAVTNIPLTPNSLILPTKVYADARGPGNSSHIWVIGDNRGAGEILELDPAGMLLRQIIPDPSGSFGSITADVDPATGVVRNVYVGDFRNGNIWTVDASTGTFGPPTLGGATVLGLTTGGFGNVWSTDRTSVALNRLDPMTLNQETATTVGAGVQSAVATLWQHATVVDPFGDPDGDTIPSFLEIQNGSSPFDACSTPRASLSVEGAASIGSATALQLNSSGGFTGIYFGTGRATPPLTIPGIACTGGIDPMTVLPLSLVFTGTSTLPLTIPADPGLVGTTLYAQGVNQLTGTPDTFCNTTCWVFY